jgi:hypothetical protein
VKHLARFKQQHGVAVFAAGLMLLLWLGTLALVASPAPSDFSGFNFCLCRANHSEPFRTDPSQSEPQIRRHRDFSAATRNYLQTCRLLPVPALRLSASLRKISGLGGSGSCESLQATFNTSA